MTSRRGNTGPGHLPLQLQGLQSWQFIHPASVGHFHDAYFDVCWCPTNDSARPDSRGVYLLVGTATAALASANAQALVLGPAGGVMGDVTGIAVGGVSPITGIATYRRGQALLEGTVKVVAAGAGSASMFVRSPDIFTGASWASNGSWATAAVSTVPSHVVFMPGHNYMHIAGHQAGTGRYISRKALTTDNTDEWAHPTLPGGGGTGDSIVKFEGGYTSYLMALDSVGRVLGSTDTTGSAYFQDATTSVMDITYSNTTNQFGKVTTNNIVATVTAGDWGAAGPINWTNHPLPFGSDANNYLVALECGWPPLSVYASTNQYIADQEVAETWWLAAGNANQAVVTKDFEVYYSVPLPLSNLATVGFSTLHPQRLKFKFCKDRLFIFGPHGVAISGTIGFGYRPRRPNPA